MYTVYLEQVESIYYFNICNALLTIGTSLICPDPQCPAGELHIVSQGTLMLPMGISVLQFFFFWRKHTVVQLVESCVKQCLYKQQFSVLA
jgi:hypothetical protein